MARCKENNQYYGKYFECCVVNQINKEDKDLYKENYCDFSTEEKEDIQKDAMAVAQYLNANKAEYTGNLTGSAKGDVFLPDTNEFIELKYVSFGKGTYWNTSLSYFEKFNFNFQEYLCNFGLISLLKECFGSQVSVKDKNKSPVSAADSSFIRHNHSDLYKEKIVPLDEEIRKKFVKDLVAFFSENEEATRQFLADILIKNSLTSQKGKPDRLIIFNYETKKITEFKWEEIFNSPDIYIKTTDKGFTINNIRIAIGWQNGNGLNNPTLRVFL